MRYLIFFIYLLISMNMFHQDSEVFDISAYDMDKYQKKIFKKFKRLNCYDEDDNYSVLFMYHLELKDYSREVFTNKRLMENVKFIFHKWQKNFPSNEAVIYNDSLEIPAYSDNLRVTCTFNYPLFNELLKYAIEEQVELIFRISGSNMKIYFALKNKQLYALRVEPDHFSVKPLDEFVQCCWESLRLTPH